MAVQPYFDHYGNDEERALLNDLNVEAIQIHGKDMLYVPRRTYDRDGVFTEDASRYFDTAYTLEFYLKNVEGFQGMGSILSSLGTALRDQITLQVSITRFEEEVLASEDATLYPQRRPREGDLVWFPEQSKMFEIVFVDKFTMMFPLGGLYLWELSLELFEYSSEKFSTGVPEIDDAYNPLSQDVIDWAIKDEAGQPILAEDGSYIYEEEWPEGDLDPEDQSDEIQEETDDFLDFTEGDPFSESGPEHHY